MATAFATIEGMISDALGSFGDEAKAFAIGEGEGGGEGEGCGIGDGVVGEEKVGVGCDELPDEDEDDVGCDDNGQDSPGAAKHPNSVNNDGFDDSDGDDDVDDDNHNNDDCEYDDDGQHVNGAAGDNDDIGLGSLMMTMYDDGCDDGGVS